MKDQFQDFTEVLTAMGQWQVDYILIGGVAMILHGLPRLTRHIDILVRMDADNIEKLRKALPLFSKIPSSKR